MKKHVLLGVLLALIAVLILSCNKNRFNIEDPTIESSGQWKLPIGSVSITLGEVVDQMNQDSLISYDPQGNLLISIMQAKDDLVRGKNYLSLGTLNFNSTSSFANPFPGVVLPYPIDTVYYFDQKMLLTSDSARLETVVIKSGTLVVNFITNLGNIRRIDMWSPDITFPNGDTLHEQFSETNHEVDIAGATFRLVDPETGEQDSSFVLNYAIHYQLTGIDDPEYEVNTIIGLNRLKLEEMSGYINSFQYPFDTVISLPLNSFDGQMGLKGARVKIMERNTFGNLSASLVVDAAEFCGNGLSPIPVLNQYPVELEITPSMEYKPIYNEVLDLSVDSRLDNVRISAHLDYSPSSSNQLLYVHDTSSLGLGVEATVPMSLTASDVTYSQFFKLNMPDISMPDLIEEVILGLHIESEIPIDFDADLYSYDSIFGRITDTIATNVIINGSYDGHPVVSDASISISQSLLENMRDSNKVLMRLKLDTNGKEVLLNRNMRLGVALKADIIYKGSIE